MTAWLRDTYSPDLALTDHYHFHSLDNQLRAKFFANETDLRQSITDFFSTPDFYLQSIVQLKSPWQNVPGADGDYFKDLKVTQLCCIRFLSNKSKTARTFLVTTSLVSFIPVII